MKQKRTFAHSVLIHTLRRLASAEDLETREPKCKYCVCVWYAHMQISLFTFLVIKSDIGGGVSRYFLIPSIHVFLVDCSLCLACA
ncbi:hypothetical protein F4778DRAFT_225743 [Xylariomycetidae sp. FL2044]|nr:hypothetical protein F4778DRAFT_225743 [Xylariomycetidae sp. FL2044]